MQWCHFSPFCTDSKTKAQKENGKRAAGRGPGKKSQVPKIEELPTPADAGDKLKSAEPTADSEIVGVSEEAPIVPPEPSNVEVGPVTTASIKQDDGAQLDQGTVSLECGQPTQEADNTECGQPTGGAASMECGQVVQEVGSTECGQPQDEASVECRQPTQKASSAEYAQETTGNRAE